MNELVSVIVPFYNAENTIISCCRSLQEQTYSKFEVLLIDDGSTDQGPELAGRLKDTRFCLFSTEHLGVSHARNKGLELARGAYVAFVDVDDTVKPEYLQTLLTCAADSGADIVLCNYEEQSESGQWTTVRFPMKEEVLHAKEIRKELIPRMIYAAPSERIPGRAWRSLIRTAFWEKEPVYFREDITMAEDLLFSIALCHKADSIFLCESPLYEYRRNIASITKQAASGFDPAFLERNRYYHKVFSQLLETENLLEENREQYNACKACMYTSLISNASRANEYDDARRELEQVRKSFVQEELSWKRLPIGPSRKTALWLLSHGWDAILLSLFKRREAWVHWTNK